LVTRLRGIAEHVATSGDDDPLRNTRTTQAGPLARTFLAPYWVNYHIEHHLLVFVPCLKLRSAPALLLAKGYRPRMELAPATAMSCCARHGRERDRQFDLSPALWQDRRRHLRRRDGSVAPTRSPGRRR